MVPDNFKGVQQHVQHQGKTKQVTWSWEPDNFQNVAIEDLNVAGIMKGSTPKTQADAGMGETKRQIIYKAQCDHCKVQLAHRFYPSSKTCSNCQTVNAKLKREPVWQCSNCFTTHDRNINAAVNLRELLTLLPTVGRRPVTGMLWPLV